MTIEISAVATAGATAVIAYYAWKSHQLSLALKTAEESRIKREEEFQQQLSDLYQAIVVATLLSGPSSTGAFTAAKHAFESQYKGKTKIFKE